MRDRMDQSMLRQRNWTEDGEHRQNGEAMAGERGGGGSAGGGGEVGKARQDKEDSVHYMVGSFG